MTIPYWNCRKRKPQKLSKKKLFEDLATLGFDNPTLKAKYISDETYGKKSMIYVHAGTLARRIEVENTLEQKGHRIHREYWPGSGTLEVEVTYFKGQKWDE